MRTFLWNKIIKSYFPIVITKSKFQHRHNTLNMKFLFRPFPAEKTKNNHILSDKPGNPNLMNRKRKSKLKF